MTILDWLSTVPPAAVALVASIVGGLATQLWLRPRFARSDAEIAEAQARAAEARKAAEVARAAAEVTDAMVKQRDAAMKERDAQAGRVEKMRREEIARLEAQIAQQREMLRAVKYIAAERMSPEQRAVFQRSWNDMETAAAELDTKPAELDYPKANWPSE